MDLKLNGRVAVITGPAKGMGAAITMAFAAEGARLALVGRDTAAIEPVAQEARAAGAEAIVVPCDLTDATQCEQAAAADQRGLRPHRHPGECRRRLRPDRQDRRRDHAARSSTTSSRST